MNATVTSKAQFTLPKDLRQLLGAGPGDRIEFEAACSASQIEALRIRGDLFSVALSHVNTLDESPACTAPEVRPDAAHSVQHPEVLG